MSDEKPRETTEKATARAPRKGRKRRGAGPANGFSTYIHKVLKSINPDLGISKRSMLIMSAMIEDIFNRMLVNASDLARINKRQTLTHREITAALTMVMPTELVKHARAEVMKALASYEEATISPPE